MHAFSSSETAVLERKADVRGSIHRTAGRNIDLYYELDRCAEWAKKNGLCKICLQFPDALLHESVEVALCLGKRLGSKPYILADTSYGSCCVDEVAAKHVNADGIIHFGHACLTPTDDHLHKLYVFEKLPVDCQHFVSCFRCVFECRDAKILLLYDVCYQHAIESVVELITSEFPDVVVSELATSNRSPEAEVETKLGRNFKLLSGSILEEYSVVFIGRDGPTLSNIALTFLGKALYWYDPAGVKKLEHYNVQNSKFLMKRMHLIERIKDAKTLGVVVGTLGVSKYLVAVDRLKELARQQGKKLYIIAVGKPSVSKLANFPEIDIFVLIACPENSLLDSKEFYRPIVTPYEVELACNANREWSQEYILEFHNLLPGGRHYQELETSQSNTTEGTADVSLVTGQIRVMPERESSRSSVSSSDAVALKGDSAVSTDLATGSEFLSKRSWQGLEQNLGQNDVVLASKGRSGVPQNYDTDLDTMS
jgi:diphthamide biosynthesis protein 2